MKKKKRFTIFYLRDFYGFYEKKSFTIFIYVIKVVEKMVFLKKKKITIKYRFNITEKN